MQVKSQQVTKGPGFESLSVVQIFPLVTTTFWTRTGFIALGIALGEGLAWVKTFEDMTDNVLY